MIPNWINVDRSGDVCTTKIKIACFEPIIYSCIHSFTSILPSYVATYSLNSREYAAMKEIHDQHRK